MFQFKKYPKLVFPILRQARKLNKDYKRNLIEFERVKEVMLSFIFKIENYPNFHYTGSIKGMKEQGFGQIYNVEGYGSNDAIMTGLSIYGTTKRAVTYFTEALANESKDSLITFISLEPSLTATTSPTLSLLS